MSRANGGEAAGEGGGVTRSAKDLMHRDVGVVEASASLGDLERSFAEAKVSGFPVVDRGRVVGVITRTDVIRRLAHDEEGPSTYYDDLGPLEPRDVVAGFDEVASRAGDEPTVADLMTRSIIAVAPDDALSKVARTLVEQRVHRVIVVDGHQLVGIVGALDLARLVAEGELVLAD
jgi:CBS domain-containing protein